MVHEFKAGDWVTANGGDRLLVIARDMGLMVCRDEWDDYNSFHPTRLTLLPGCTGWDWEPPAEPAPEPSPALRYRLLSLGETILPTDEHYIQLAWSPVQLAAGHALNVCHAPIRRVMPRQEPPAASEPEPSAADVVYVAVAVQRAVWDSLGGGEDVPFDPNGEALELIPITRIPGATLFLLPD